MKEWLVSGSINFILGFVFGWIVVARPQWATNLLTKLRTKIGF